MGESMFGKRERLYADTRAPQEKPASPPPPPPTPKKSTVAPPRPRMLDVPPPAQVDSKARGIYSTMLELSGVAFLAGGGFLVAPWLGCMMLGLFLVVLGVASGFGA